MNLDKLKSVEPKEHAIKIENLEMSRQLADQYLSVIKDFITDLEFPKDRIDSFECRSRDGFSPYSHNKGGLEGVSYLYSTYENTGFDKVDEVQENHRQNATDAWYEENKIDKTKVSYQDLTSDQQDDLANFETEYLQDDSIQFQARVMITSDTTANVDFYISASDAPYHRSSDDRLELEIDFKSPAGMKRKLNAILKKNFVKTFIRNVRETY